MTTIDLTNLLGWAIRPTRPRPQGKSDGAQLGSTRDGRSVRLATPGSVQAAHVLVLAASGAGKTQMVAGALVEEIERDLARPARQRSAFLIADPKGDLVATLLQRFTQDIPQALASTHYLNPFQHGGFPMNLCRVNSSVPVEIQALALAELVGSISTAAGAQAVGLGQRQVDALHHLLLAALTVPQEGASPLLALDALAQHDGLSQLASLTTHDRAREFLAGGSISGELRASLSSRLRSAFAPTAAIERLFAAARSVDFAELLGPGGIVLLDVGAPPGGRMSLRRFFANSTARLGIDLSMSRPSPFGGHHLRVVLDELQIFAPVLHGIAEDVLTTGRSRSVSLVGLSQGTALIQDTAPELLALFLGNAQDQLYGRMAARDAEILSRSVAQAPGVDESLGSTRARHVAALCNLPDREFFSVQAGGRTRFRSKELPELGELTTRQRDRLQEVRRRHALPPTFTRVTLADLTASRTGRRPSATRRTAITLPGPKSGRGRWG